MKIYEELCKGYVHTKQRRSEITFGSGIARWGEISRKWKVKLEGKRRRGSFETQYKAMDMTHVKHGLSSN